LVVVTLAALPLHTRPARAVDEIQLYNAEIADVGQFTIQHHFNYAFSGRKEPDFPGGLTPNHASTPRRNSPGASPSGSNSVSTFRGPIDSEGRFLSNAAKLRTLFVTPNADKKNFFYGLNFEYDYTTPRFSETRFAMEIRPIIGWRNPQWEFIVNPIVDLGFGSRGDIDFVPAARLARTLSKDLAFGLEYYTALGRPGSFLPFEQQAHQLFAVVDFRSAMSMSTSGLATG